LIGKSTVVKRAFRGHIKIKSDTIRCRFIVLLRIEVRLSQAEFTCLTEIYKVWSTCVLIEMGKRDGETWCILDHLALSTHPFCGSKELFLRRNVAPFAVEKEWYCGDFCATKRNGSPPLKKEEREKWKEKEYFLKKTKRTVNEKRKNC